MVSSMGSNATGDGEVIDGNVASKAGDVGDNGGMTCETEVSGVILSLFLIIVLSHYFISHYCFGSVILFPIVVLQYYFISYSTHIMPRL